MRAPHGCTVSRGSAHPCLDVARRLLTPLGLLCLTTLAFVVSCGKDKTTGSEYLGKWKGRYDFGEYARGQCQIEISQLGESFLLKSNAHPYPRCASLFSGVFTLTPEGNLKGGTEYPLVIAFDKAQNQLVVDGAGGVQYLTKVSTEQLHTPLPERYITSVADDAIEIYATDTRDALILRFRALNQWSSIAQFDVNQNHAIDSHIDVSYANGRSTTPCFQYLLDSRSSTTCGAFRSSATLALQDEHGIWQSTTWTIPKVELSSSDEAWLVVDSYNSETKQFIRGSFGNPIIIPFRNR